jgi:hypothetical protein
MMFTIVQQISYGNDSELLDADEGEHSLTQFFHQLDESQL